MYLYVYCLWGKNITLSDGLSVFWVKILKVLWSKIILICCVIVNVNL